VTIYGILPGNDSAPIVIALELGAVVQLDELFDNELDSVSQI